jgi:hypothetical protein
MTVTVEFFTDNDAFMDDFKADVVHQLRNVADSISNGQLSGAVRDYNGNTIGRYDALSEGEPRRKDHGFQLLTLANTFIPPREARG